MGQVAAWAGHCGTHGRDAVWAAVILDDGRYVCAHGRRGSRLGKSGSKKFASVAAARQHFEEKVAEKQREGYVQVEFGTSTYYRIPPFDLAAGSVLATPAAPPSSAPDVPAAAIEAPSFALTLDAADLDRYLDDPAWGLTEAVDGVLCLIASFGGDLHAYDPQGRPVAAVPEGAQALARLPGPFVIDGLCLADGSYVALDARMWNGQDLHGRPYTARIGLLERALQQHELVLYSGAIRPRVMPGSTQKQLALLVARTEGKRQIVDTLRASGAAGLLLRQVDAVYESGDSPSLRQLWFTPEPVSASV